MKKLMLATAILSLSTLAHANTVRLVNGDGSELSQMCIEAVEGAEISPLLASEALCNNKPLARFVAGMRKTLAKTETTYVLAAKAENELAALCIASAKSDEAFEAARQEMFGNDLSVANDLFCNGMPVKAFARKYRKLLTTSSL